MNDVVVIIWLQHRFFAPENYRVHFPDLEKTLNCLTLPFSIREPLNISFIFFFVLKAVMGCSWNSFSRFLLVWKMFQIFQAATARFGKNQLYVNNNGMRFESCCSQSFFCRRRFLTGYLPFHFFLFMVVT